MNHPTIIIIQHDYFRLFMYCYYLFLLFSVGEDQANIATVLAIPYLLRLMHTFTIAGSRKPVDPTRAQVSNSFLPIVPTVGDIPSYYLKRVEHISSYLESIVPYIIAVGSTWKEIKQYDLVLTEDVRYTFNNLMHALVALYKIFWVFDLPYPKKSQSMWMFVRQFLIWNLNMIQWEPLNKNF